MKLNLDSSDQKYLIKACTRYGNHLKITVGEHILTTSVILAPGKIIQWEVNNVSQLSVEDFSFLAGLQTEVIILGTGINQIFPKPELYFPLIETGTGLEVMDTPAACRTYNMLLVDGRKVATAVIL